MVRLEFENQSDDVALYHYVVKDFIDNRITGKSEVTMFFGRINGQGLLECKTKVKINGRDICQFSISEPSISEALSSALDEITRNLV